MGCSHIPEERIPERSKRRKSRYPIYKTSFPPQISFLCDFCIQVLQTQTARGLCFCVIQHVLLSYGRNQTYKYVSYFLSRIINAIICPSFAPMFGPQLITNRSAVPVCTVTVHATDSDHCTCSALQDIGMMYNTHCTFILYIHYIYIYTYIYISHTHTNTHAQYIPLYSILYISMYSIRGTRWRSG